MHQIVERVINVFVIYEVFVVICLFLFAEIIATALITRLDNCVSIFKILPLRILQNYTLFNIA